MKYWRFAHDDYMPDGGINDLQGEFDSLSEAQQFHVETKIPYPVDYIILIADNKFTGLVWHKEKDGTWKEYKRDTPKR